MSSKRYTAGALAVLAALSFSLATAPAAEGEPLTNLDVIGFVQANISPNLVVDKIRNSPADFDLSESGLAALRAAGVSEEILAAMRLVGGQYGSASTLSALPGLGVPPRPAPPTTASLQPPSLGEIPPSPFGATPSPSPFTALEPLPSVPPPAAPVAAPASVPSLPSLPSLAATPPASAPAEGFSSPTMPQARPVEPVAQSGFSSPAAAGFAAGPGVVAPVSAIAPLSPLAPSAPPAPATPAAGPASSLDANRFRAELATITSGPVDARRTAMAWLIANQAATLQPLREALHDTRPEIQSAAVYALGTMRDGQSLPEVRRLIVSPSPLVRANAAEVLAEMEDGESIAAAERALGAAAEPLDGYIRLVGHARLVRAAGSLSSILLNNQSVANRAAAAWSLAEIGRAGSVAWPALESALLEDSEPSVRREAVRAVAVFHDPASAKLLETACRRDPEVRKLALQAMADYPSTVEFLVGVMNLGNEQIAADELEAARSSLAKLTGEDYGMDGGGWSRWFGANKARLAAQPPPASGLSVAPPPPPASPPASETAVATGRQVDVRAWGIVTDPNEIPMAPEVDATPNLRQAGIVGGFGGMAAGGPLPPPPSSDIVEGPMGQRGASSVADGGSMLGGGWGMADTPAYGGAFSGPTMPSDPVVAPQPATATTSGEGVRLPLPPGLIGAGGSDTQTPMYGSSAAMPGSVAAPVSPAPSYDTFAADPYAAYGTTPAPIGSYSSDIIVPTADGAVGTPLYGSSPTVDVIAGTTYTTPTNLSDEVHSQPYESTGDLVPDAAQAVPMYTGQPEPSPLDSLPESYITEVPVEPTPSESAMSGFPPPPGGYDPAEIDTGDYGTIAFPGDTDTFGLGDQYFDSEDPRGSDGSPSLFGGMVMPPPPGGAASASSDDGYGYAEAGEGEDDYPGTLGGITDFSAPDESFGESFEYDFDHPDSPYSSVVSGEVDYDGFTEAVGDDDDEWGEVEDLSNYPAFGEVIQGRVEEETPAAVTPATSGQTSSGMTVTTERAQRTVTPAAPATPAPAASGAAPSASSPQRPVEIPPDASEKAGKILSALAEIEMGGGSPSPAAPASPAGAIPPHAVPQPDSVEEVFEDVYVGEDEVYDLDDYPGGFIPAAPSSDGPAVTAPVGTAEEMPLLGDNLAPLPIPSDSNAITAEEEEETPAARRRRAQ